MSCVHLSYLVNARHEDKIPDDTTYFFNMVMISLVSYLVLFCFVLFCFVLVLFCSVLFCSVLYCIALHCIVLYCFALVWFCFVLFCFVLSCFGLAWFGLVWLGFALVRSDLNYSALGSALVLCCVVLCCRFIHVVALSLSCLFLVASRRTIAPWSPPPSLPLPFLTLTLNPLLSCSLSLCPECPLLCLRLAATSTRRMANCLSYKHHRFEVDATPTSNGRPVFFADPQRFLHTLLNEHRCSGTSNHKARAIVLCGLVFGECLPFPSLLFPSLPLTLPFP